MSIHTARIVAVLGPVLFLAGLVWLAFGGSGTVWRPAHGIGGLTVILLSIVLTVQSWRILIRELRKGQSASRQPPPVPTRAAFAGAPVIDLRPASARQNEERAQRPLAEEDEKMALELAQLSENLSVLDAHSEAARECARMIREMGEDICKNGGTGRMDLICYRVHYLCGTSRYVRYNWSGICGWEY